MDATTLTIPRHIHIHRILPLPAAAHQSPIPIGGIPNPRAIPKARGVRGQRFSIEGQFEWTNDTRRDRTEVSYHRRVAKV
jgi:hypothetical protein